MFFEYFLEAVTSSNFEKYMVFACFTTDKCSHLKERLVSELTTNKEY